MRGRPVLDSKKSPPIRIFPPTPTPTPTHAYAMAASAPIKPTLAVPAELGDKQWTLAPASWFIQGETRRPEGESDEDYVERVLKNKRIRDRSHARQVQHRAEFATYLAMRSKHALSAPQPAPAPAPAPAENWKETALYWQRRCEAMEGRLKTVVAAVGELSRLTNEETARADEDTQ